MLGSGLTWHPAPDLLTAVLLLLFRLRAFFHEADVMAAIWGAYSW